MPLATNGRIGMTSDWLEFKKFGGLRNALYITTPGRHHIKVTWNWSTHAQISTSVVDLGIVRSAAASALKNGDAAALATCQQYVANDAEELANTLQQWAETHPPLLDQTTRFSGQLRCDNDTRPGRAGKKFGIIKNFASRTPQETPRALRFYHACAISSPQPDNITSVSILYLACTGMGILTPSGQLAANAIDALRELC